MGRLEPVRDSERIPELDVVRGFAVFGVLVAYTVWNLGGPPEETWATVDRLSNEVTSLLVDGKFYSLFTFLFGLGFSIQLSRASSRGADIVPVFCRRLFALLAIGLAHALLLRNGDILVPYAVMGFVLLALRNAPDRTLLVLVIVGLLYPYVAGALWELAGLPLPQRPEPVAASYLSENFAWVRYWYTGALLNWPASLPLFLLGLYFGRRWDLRRLGDDPGGLRRAIVAGLTFSALALVAHSVVPRASSGAPPHLATRAAQGLFWTIHCWTLALAYAAALVLALRSRAGRRALGPLGAVGRMALTNYLLQAALVVPVCLAFGLFDRVTPSLGLLLAAAVTAVQVPVSVWWLARYRFGPAEWLWRSLTYGRPQPMRAANGRSMPAEA